MNGLSYEEWPSVKPRFRQQFSIEQQELLDDIVEVYLPKTAYELEQMTHDEDPWVIARNGLEPDKASHQVITHDMMQIYYVKLLRQGEVNATSYLP